MHGAQKQDVQLQGLSERSEAYIYCSLWNIDYDGIAFSAWKIGNGIETLVELLTAQILAAELVESHINGTVGPFG